jgi:hypothetical protein
MHPFVLMSGSSTLFAPSFLALFKVDNFLYSPHLIPKNKNPLKKK